MTAPITERGTILGTLQYMAPEQLEGREADARTDLWALGAILYEMVTGRRAFAGDSQASLIGNIMNTEPASIGALQPLTPPALERVVKKCLAKHPDDRWDGAHDVADELRWIAQTSSANNSGAATTKVSPRWRRRRAWIAAAAVLLALAGTVAWVSLRGPVTPPSSPTFTRKTYRPMTVFRAAFNPDGQTITMSAAFEGNVPDLYEIHPGDPEPRPLGLRRTHLLSISSKGELAVLTNVRYINHHLFSGTLATFSPGTEPREQFDDVREAAWSPDGADLAVVRTVGGKDRIEYPRDKVLYEESGGYLSDVCVSPTGTHVAFVQHNARYNNAGRLIVVEVSSRRSVAGNVVYESVEGVSWLPGGREVLFASGATFDDLAIRAMDLQGRERIVLSAPGRPALHDVSPTGRWIVSQTDQYYGMRTRGPGVSAETEVGWLNGSVPEGLSADGRRLLFVEQGFGTFKVCVRGTDRSAVKTLGDGLPQGISPDGREVLVVAHDGSRLEIHPMGVGTRRTIERGQLERIRGAAWLPDGKRVLACGNEAARPPRCYVNDGERGAWRAVTRNGTGGVVSPDGREVIVLDFLEGPSRYRLDGSLAPLAIPGVSTSDIPVAWSRDGRSAYFTDRLEMPGRICRVDLATGKREVKYTFGLTERSGVLRWLSPVMARDADAYAYGFFRELSTLYVVEHTPPSR